MKVSVLIERLNELQEDQGDLDVFIDDGFCTSHIGEIDLGSSDEGIIIWTGEDAA